MKKGHYIIRRFGLVIISIVHIAVFCQPYPYKFNYLTVDAGLSHTDANDIAQDKQGYIWIATYFGLNRFDGYAVKKYYNNNEPLRNSFKNRVNHVCPDGDGNIWLGTEGGLQCFNVREEKYIDFKGIAKERNPGFGKLYKPSGSLLYAPVTGLFDLQVLEKILFNLLNNAFKYTDAGGEVQLDIFFDINKFKPSFDYGLQLLNETCRANKYVYFHVIDSGIGISGESLARIFDRYYRISNDHLGSGVRLALVKNLTLLHKGDIYVYSGLQKGTEIIIGIPWGGRKLFNSRKSQFPGI